LSPQKGKTSAPLSGGQKKRKLNAQGSSPVAGTLSTISRKIGGFLGFGGRKGKENLREAEEEEDELAGEKDIFDVEVSEPEDSERTQADGRGSRTGSQRRSGRQKREVLSPIPKTSTKSSATKKATPEKPKVDIYDVAVSDDEGSGATGSKSRDTIERTKSILKEKRTPGRPRKSDILKRDKAVAREEARKRIAEEDEDPVADEVEEEVETPKRRKTRNRIDENSRDDADTQMEAPPSTSKRGRPKKVPQDDSMPISAPPKGILTPSRGRPGRSRKSVAFEREGTDVDLGFKDLPKSASNKKAKAPSPDLTEETQEAQKEGDSAAEESSSEGEEAACAICSKLNSRKGNEILFCDGCEKAVHQKCYDVPVIPKGDWFCRDCKPDAEDEMDLAVNEASTGVDPQSELPDIERFEDHLRIAQRVVLDKLTGQGRLKLCGHDEQMQKVHQLVEQTVLAGEGNSMLVIGGRGCGKTTVSYSAMFSVLNTNLSEQLVESVISDISAEHRDNFHVVRLNGFIHTDDKIALREMWRQLGREMEVEDDLVGKVISQHTFNIS
jgi:origin recognition complex subunit 4